MPVDMDKLAPFKEICRKICLNIPHNASWQWDHKRVMALVTLEQQDADLVFFPLVKEFELHRKFTSPETTETPISRLISSEYGILPGQSFFISLPINDLVLFVAWWPRGKTGRISMRVGLFPLSAEKIDHAAMLNCLKNWLPMGS
jgi:hypothetical protein